jgi:hypothetical protein
VIEQRCKVGLQKVLVLAAETMVSFSHHIFDLAANNRYLEQGDEAEDHNTALELPEKVAFAL